MENKVKHVWMKCEVRSGIDEKAILILAETHVLTWIPRSFIDEIKGECKRGSHVEILIPEWVAKKRNLICVPPTGAND